MAGLDGSNLVRGPEVTDPVSTITIPLPHNDEITVQVTPTLRELPDVELSVPHGYRLQVDHAECGRLWIRLVQSDV